jgi:hypothetical protein
LTIGCVLGVAWFARSPHDAESQSREGDAAAPHEDQAKDERLVSDAERLDAIARAQVWREPLVPVSQAKLGSDPAAPRMVTCKFKMSALGGTTPKFDCELESGEEVRIKYGSGAEIPSEAAATRLLHALGFGADQVTLVERLRCLGCPAEPFTTMKAVEVTRAEPVYERVIDYGGHREFRWVALERKFSARPIETEKLKGWAFFELDAIDPARGGAPRAHVDALRLVAAFLAHWDNKPENQRLVCLTSPWPADTRCAQPFLMVQDVGAAFGPRKVDLDAWEQAAIWEDRASCTVTMRDLPYDGATFDRRRVTEAGRQFFGTLVGQLSNRQIADLFVGARFDHDRGLLKDARPVHEWVRAFKTRVRTIVEGAPCPE